MIWQVLFLPCFISVFFLFQFFRLLLTLISSQIIVDSFTKDDISYNLALKDQAITRCSCPAFAETGLACKHMFLAQRITTHNIHFENVVVSAPQPVLEPVAPENHREEKQRLLAKIRDGVDKLSNDALWRVVSSDEGLNKISRSNLTRLLSVIDGVKHLQTDVFLNRPDYSKQR